MPLSAKTGFWLTSIFYTTATLLFIEKGGKAGKAKLRGARGKLFGFFDQNVVGPNCPENDCCSLQLEGETIFHRHRPFPPVTCSLYPLQSQGRMGHVLQQEFQLVIESLLNFTGQVAVSFFECLAELVNLYFFSHSNPSRAVSNFWES